MIHQLNYAVFLNVPVSEAFQTDLVQHTHLLPLFILLTIPVGAAAFLVTAFVRLDRLTCAETVC